MTLSVIGCVVNGPGEARETNIGLTGEKVVIKLLRWGKAPYPSRWGYDRSSSKFM